MISTTEYQKIIDRSRAHMKFLAEELGPKPPASKDYHAASKYIESYFRDCGLLIEVQKWECPDWQELSTRLVLNGTELAAAANAFSSTCDVTAAFVFVKTMAELEIVELEGKIGVLCGELTMQPLSPKSWFLASERELHMIDLLETKSPAALITVQSNPGDLERLIEDAEFRIPSAVVPADVGRQLLENQEHLLHLAISTKLRPGHARNIIARNFSGRPPRLVMCAHYDTKHDTPGAVDNAGGISILLCLAEYFSRHQPDLNLEFVAFGSEEYLPIGDDYYIQYGEEDMFQNILAAINFDGVGRKLGANSIVMFTESAAFHQHVEEITARFPAVVWVDPWPQSNHSTFAWRGVPSIAFTSQGGPFMHHLRTDTLRWVDPMMLAEVTNLTIQIVQDIIGKPLSWLRSTEE
jgi:aminopeptidase YwaD